MTIEPRVLVVDDDVGVTKLLERALCHHAYSVRIAHDPEAVLATAREFHPDLIILDIMMPAKNGGAVAEDIRAQSDMLDIPIIFLSGTLDEAEASRASEGSSNEIYVQKPVEIPQLLAKIEECLKGTRLQSSV